MKARSPAWRRNRIRRRSCRSTNVLPWNLNSSERYLVTSTFMRSTAPGRTARAKAAVVHRDEQDGLALDIRNAEAEGFGHQDRPRLAHGLHQQHPRHHRVVGEMPLKEGLVHGHALDAHDGLVRLVILRPVDQQEGIAVRNPFQDLLHLHGRSNGRCSSLMTPCLLSLRRLRASQAISRMNLRIGLAGTPHQVSPSGIFRMVSAPAANRVTASDRQMIARARLPPNCTPSPMTVLPAMPV